MAEHDRLKDADGALDTANRLVTLAKAAGADVAEAGFSYQRNAQVSFRDGEVTDLEQAEALDLSLRVWVGDRVASLSGNQLDAAGLKDLAEQGVARAKILPPAPDITIPSNPDAATRELDMDWAEPSLDTLKADAQTLYEGVVARDGIVNSDGGSAGWGKARYALATSHGHSVTATRSGYNRSVSAEAGEGMARVRDYEASGRSHLEDLKDLETIIARAVDRTLSAVGAEPVEGFQGDVIFEPRVAKSLIGGFLAAINASAIVRGQSFLKDALNTQVFADQIQICDDPTLPRGQGSRVIDSEGHVPQPLDLIRDGILQTWLLDRRTAQRLGMETNGRASRGGGGTISPSPTNVILSGGTQSPEALISGIKRGLLVTQMMGQGLNMLSGDYSRGASGFLIEDGKLTKPVQAMTVAGSMQAMLKSMVLATDTDRDGSMHMPSALIANLSIAGLS